MDARSILQKKRDGGVLSRAESAWFLAGYVAGEIPDYFASALLALIFVRGMEPDELADFTRAMLESGERLRFPRVAAPKVDKHSTGGIGDKVSIPLAPALAACGVAVPMISGRGLGHTGGTLDKLEAIPGFRTQLSSDEFASCLERTGVALGGQTPALVPADRKLYALRDVTGLIESIPLIASSILSKKLAEGLDALVLDVKFGSGAFMIERERGAELARTMIRLAASMGVKTSAFHTCMSRPLGRLAGNALEVEESFDCLEGRGPADLRELVCAQGGELLRLAGAVATLDAGKARIARSLDDGSARGVFARVIEAQGGDPRCFDDRERLPRARELAFVRAPRDGVLAWRELRALGLAITALGGGRRVLGDPIDPAVGLAFPVDDGARVARGDVLVELRHSGRGVDEALRLVERSFEIVDAHTPDPLILTHVDGA
ncbi:MAG: thymidine phosphorylase [Planctomycetes bacterium]|nr:thymidine phosphorylase [Planctomycetota bacterium]